MVTIEQLIYAAKASTVKLDVRLEPSWEEPARNKTITYIDSEKLVKQLELIKEINKYV